MAELEIKNLGMSYDKQHQILKSLNLHVENGELVSILGPSGCGKTTTLRIIAGLLEQTDGQVLIDGNDVSKLPVHKREFGMVFQSYALFPHLTVFDNVAFGLRQRKEKSDVVRDRVDRILDVTGLKELKNRFPAALSGGQQQRVSLARALVVDPKLLLLDEPLSNLDAKLRISMREEIRRLQQQMHTTTVFVTHDQEECFAISDQVAVMNQGVIEQFDTPQNIYRAPKTVFVARFIGYENFLPITNSLSTTRYCVKDVELNINIPVTAAMMLSIRPNRIILGSTASQNVISGKIQSSTYLGSTYRYTISTSIGDLKADYTGPERLKNDQTVRLELPADALLGLKK